MKLLKQIFINSATTIITIAIIGSAYAAISSVNSGDTLTATSWNEIVTTLTSTDTNSTDLVTKAYVDSVVSAAGWVSWAGYTTTSFAMTTSALKNKMDACSSDYPGSHWASSDEIVRLWSNYPWTSTAWPRDSWVQYLHSNSSNNVYTYVHGQWWLASSSTSAFDEIIALSTSSETLVSYLSSYKLPCVY